MHGQATFSRALTHLLLVITALLWMNSFSAPAAAQGPRVSPAVLTEVLLVDETPTETKFRLSFTPKSNTFGPVGSDSSKPALGLALTTRGNSAVTPHGLRGFVRSITFDQVDTVLILRFAAAGPASVRAVSISDTTIEVTVSSGVQAASHLEAPAMSGPVPNAVDPVPGEDSYELVMLKYADVSEVVGLLTDGLTVKSNDLFIPHEPAFGSNSLTGNGYNPGPTSQAPGTDDTPLGQSVDSSIAVDRRLNAIWLKGAPDRIARLKMEIAKIDVPLDSVILETQLVELTETGARAIGFDFNNANGQLAVATFQSGQFIPAGIPAGHHLTSAALQTAIYAQVQNGQGRIVSRPRIAAQSGSTAKIITGDALPILTAITLSGVNGVSQQVQYVNVGVTLQIAPRVSIDGFVSTHVFCVVSSVTGYSQGYPTISQREAETSATVRDGDSFVIGGLTQEDTINSKSKIPVLGDVPLLGQAFRLGRSTKSKTELYIVVTPHVVHRMGQATALVVSPGPGERVMAP
jgi:general secretion pathway protein D